MNERQIVAAAIAVALAAAIAAPVPLWALAVVGLLALLAGRARTWLIIGLLALAAGSLAARAEAGLTAPSRSIDAVAIVASDAEPRPGGVVVELRVDGRRYRAFAPSDRCPELAAAVVGEEYAVQGRTGPLDGPWEWRASRHLSGRLRLESVAPLDGGAWWWRSANWLHRTVEDGLDSFSPEGRALFLGVVLGDDRGQSELETFRFRSSGLAHLTAVSGQNVAFVLIAASPMLRWLRLRWRWAATVGLLSWFAVVTRLEPSVLRAVAMALVAATAAWRGRYASGLRVVAVAVVVLVLLDPMLVWSTGFRLSVAASVALVTLARPLARALPGPRVAAEMAAVTITAQVGTAPLLLGLAGTVPALGPVANLLAVPIAGWLMVWGVVTGPVAGLAGGDLALLVGWPSRAMVWWLSTVARWFADPGLPRLGWVGVGGTTAAALALVVHSERHRTQIDRPAASRPEPIATSLRVVVALGLVATAADATGAWTTDRLVQAPGATIWSDDSAAVMQLGAGAQEDDVFGLLTTCRCSRLDVLVVTGGGRTSAGIVYDLRQVVEVGKVVALRPGDIRDAEQWVPGVITAGTLRIDLARQ